MVYNRIVYIAYEWWSTCTGHCHQQHAIRAHKKYTLKNHLNPEKRRHWEIIVCPWLTLLTPGFLNATVSHLLNPLCHSPVPGVLYPLSPSPHPWRSCTSAKTAWDVFQLWRRRHDSEIDIPPRPLLRQRVAILGLINVIDGWGGQQEGPQP